MKATHIAIQSVDNSKLTNNFSANEFTCKCGKCQVSFINTELLEKLQELREAYGSSIVITSGYRCSEHNSKIGGAKASQHLQGNAVDILGHNLNELYDLCEKHFKSVGDGRPKGFIHIDIRADKPRRWTY